MKELLLKKRICECCGSNDLELVFSNKAHLKTHQESYLFKAFVVVCKNCGFCFNSPCSVKEDLINYYANCYSVNKDIPPAYSIENRLKILKKYAGGNFVEIGRNQSSEFHKKLSKYFSSIKNIEPNNEASVDIDSIDKLPKDSVDVLAFYDVLEHIPDVKDFLHACNLALKENGVMIIEVPNIRLYSKNIMLSSVSHLNHFSANTLEKIAGNSGFQLVKISYIASRPFSFLTIFKKGNAEQNNYNEYLDNLACLKGGIKQINQVKVKIKELQNKVINTKGKVTLWCVTGLLDQFLENFELPKNAIIVDTDSRKIEHLKDKNISVFLPINYLHYIKNSELLIIFSPRNKTDILQWIERNTKETFNPKKLEVVGSGQYGEPLQI